MGTMRLDETKFNETVMKVTGDPLWDTEEPTTVPRFDGSHFGHPLAIFVDFDDFGEVFGGPIMGSDFEVHFADDIRPAMVMEPMDRQGPTRIEFFEQYYGYDRDRFLINLEQLMEEFDLPDFYNVPLVALSNHFMESMDAFANTVALAGLVEKVDNNV